MFLQYHTASMPTYSRVYKKNIHIVVKLFVFINGYLYLSHELYTKQINCLYLNYEHMACPCMYVRRCWEQKSLIRGIHFFYNYIYFREFQNTWKIPENKIRNLMEKLNCYWWWLFYYLKFCYIKIPFWLTYIIRTLT